MRSILYLNIKKKSNLDAQVWNKELYTKMSNQISHIRWIITYKKDIININHNIDNNFLVLYIKGEVSI
jgi:hypothetical protein